MRPAIAAIHGRACCPRGTVPWTAPSSGAPGCYYHGLLSMALADMFCVYCVAWLQNYGNFARVQVRRAISNQRGGNAIEHCDGGSVRSLTAGVVQESENAQMLLPPQPRKSAGEWPADRKNPDTKPIKAVQRQAAMPAIGDASGQGSYMSGREPATWHPTRTEVTTQVV